ncbi:MAG: S1 RNA-binding domain-containing protein [Phycisphaerae bacterium]
MTAAKVAFDFFAISRGQADFMSDSLVQQESENTLPPVPAVGTSGHRDGAAPPLPGDEKGTKGQEGTEGRRDEGTKGNPQSAIRNPQSAIRNPQSPIPNLLGAAATASVDEAACAIPARGAELVGRVTSIDSEQLYLDVGLIYKAVVPVRAFRNGSVPEIGSELGVLVVRFDLQANVLRAYCKGTVAEADIDTLVPGAIVEGKITGLIKGGLEAQFGTLRGFMPASQVNTKPMKDISLLLGEQVRCEVLEIDPKGRQLVVSRRNILAKEQVAARERLFSELKVGQVHKGVVSGLADFGVFVDLGGLRGLVHVSDLKWTAVAKPGDVVQPGDKVDVKVLKINKKRKRISLGIKQVTPDPWADVEKTYPVGTSLKVRVVKLAEFGAFAEITEGVNGLIPLGEMSWLQRPAHASELLELEQVVDVGVIKVEAKRRRIGLSIKQVTEDPWLKVAEGFSVNSVVAGKVTKLLDFGVLVELKPGVEGMVHISELSDNRVKTPSDVVSSGEQVSVRVLSVDPKKRRIGLTIKGLNAKEASSAPMPATEPKQKRQKPLRGGLSSHFNW